MTHDELKQLLDYDPATGVFKWRLGRRGRYGRAGDPAGSLHTSGYIHIRINQTLYKAHRLAWFYVYGSWPTGQIDHINRTRSDNRISNLRCATPTENSLNRGPYINPHPGVTWDAPRKKWRVQKRIDGVTRSLGRFESLDEAKAAWDRA